VEEQEQAVFHFQPQRGIALPGASERGFLPEIGGRKRFLLFGG